MKVMFAQPDFPFAERTLPLVKRVANKLAMQKMLTSVMLDIIDYGSPSSRNPSDSIEVYSNGGVRLHLRYDHFLKRKYHHDPRRRDPKATLPARAFDQKRLPLDADDTSRAARQREREIPKAAIQIEHVVAHQSFSPDHDQYIGIERRDRLLSRLRLGRSDPSGVVQHLPLQVGRIHPVVVDHGEGADSGGGQIERRRRAEAPGTDEHHPALQQALLALLSDLGKDEMAGVPAALLRSQTLGATPGQPGDLPCRHSTGHRCHTVVAHVLQSACRQCRPVSRRTDEQDLAGGRQVQLLKRLHATRS